MTSYLSNSQENMFQFILAFACANTCSFHFTDQSQSLNVNSYKDRGKWGSEDLSRYFLDKRLKTLGFLFLRVRIEFYEISLEKNNGGNFLLNVGEVDEVGEIV